MIEALVSLFIYSFNAPGVLKETPSATLSTSPYFWLNSGGYLVMNGTEGATVQGDLPETDVWHTRYATGNPLDTDGGAHPQSLFRLFTKQGWDSFAAQASFFIEQDQLSESPNRNASNGLLLMSRYRDDGRTLYYAGIRVDGTAVIKKKYSGTYYTMAQKKVFPGTYDRTTAPNLLPHDEWIDLKQTTRTNPNGSVTVSLAIKRAGERSWTELVSATDDGNRYGRTPALRGASAAGIRTDFMDVRFDNYRLEKR